MSLNTTMPTSDVLLKYAPIWNRYRLAIFKMMLTVAFEPQQYQPAQHALQKIIGKEWVRFWSPCQQGVWAKKPTRQNGR